MIKPIVIKTREQLADVIRDMEKKLSGFPIPKSSKLFCPIANGICRKEFGNCPYMKGGK